MEKVDSGYENLVKEKKAFSLKNVKQLGYTTYSFHFCSYSLFGISRGLISLLAFLSYWIQADALIGADGITPWNEDLYKIEQLAKAKPDLSRYPYAPPYFGALIPGEHTTLFAIGSLSYFALILGWVTHKAVIFSCPPVVPHSRGTLS